MSFYWLYDLPTWVSFLVIVFGAVGFSLLGQFLLGKYVKQWWKHKHDNNDLLSFYLSGISMFYSITLGLIAVGTWETYQSTSDTVIKESASLASLYRVCKAFPAPSKGELTAILRQYTDHVIAVDWQEHSQGIVTNSSTLIVDKFQKLLFAFDPSTNKESILFQEAIEDFDKFVEIRRIRIASVTSGIPTVLWTVVLMGGFINLVTIWLFIPETKIQGILLNVLFSLTIGIMVFCIVMLDHPFRGGINITSEPFEIVRQQLMVN